MAAGQLAISCAFIIGIYPADNLVKLATAKSWFDSSV